MSRVWIDIDDEALARAAEILGTETAEETINNALRATTRNHDRAAALAEMRSLVAEGGVDIDVAHDKRRYRR
ncbi:type II toxin-antitoxin system VapB family antitoxin [Nocardiopsis ganjiahuensis]|uniref:type II toxin-antitoxin system VapB family antitoxin n=1 Tax=Nocardiopsis ganjiahuensis TaxID=239984 RepID=UPI0003636B39|nr:type II toxin-antitoxin system VapB family antitoxin [Nocardiopsis ganjiahuensis]